MEDELGTSSSMQTAEEPADENNRHEADTQEEEVSNEDNERVTTNSKGSESIWQPGDPFPFSVGEEESASERQREADMSDAFDYVFGISNNGKSPPNLHTVKTVQEPRGIEGSSSFYRDYESGGLFGLRRLLPLSPEASTLPSPRSQLMRAPEYAALANDKFLSLTKSGTGTETAHSQHRDELNPVPGFKIKLDGSGEDTDVVSGPGEVFLSFASSERETIAAPLIQLLKQLGIRVISDFKRPDLTEGSVVDGFDRKEWKARVRVGVVILSPNYMSQLAKRAELRAMTSLVSEAMNNNKQPPLLIPLLYRPASIMNSDDIVRSLSTWVEGRDYPAEVDVDLRTILMFPSVGNDEGAQNYGDEVNIAKRHRYVQRAARVIADACERIGLIPDEVADPNIVTTALRQGKEKLDTVRLMVLGGPGRGKTSTIASLRRRPFEENRDSTEGIDLSIYHIVLGRKEGDRIDEALLSVKDKFQSKLRSYATSLRMRAFEFPTDTPLEFHTQNVHETLQSLEQTDQSSGDERRVSPVRSRSDTENRPSLAQAPPAVSTEEDEDFDEDVDDDTDIDNMEENVNRLIQEAKNAERTKIAMESLTVRCWDFGGQPEYEVAHEMFISPRSAVMLVFNMEQFVKAETREKEVRELSSWLQMIFAATADSKPEIVANALFIVATHSAACSTAHELREELEEMRGMVMEMLDDGAAEMFKVGNIPMFAIENRTALQNHVESGLTSLERHLNMIARKIINNSEEVPLRWLAFIENLQNDNDIPAEQRCLSLSKAEVEERMKGFAFPPSELDRGTELNSLLLRYRDLGELVLFDRTSMRFSARTDSYEVFLHPERILRALKKIVAPERVRCRGLRNGSQLKLMREGVVTKEVLREKWGTLEGLSEEEQRMGLADLLCGMDVFVKLSENAFGIPALREKGWEGLDWMERVRNRYEVCAISKFSGYVPYGLIGTFVGRLHRKMGKDSTKERRKETEEELTTKVRYIRGNGILLALREGVGKLTQLFMGFDKHSRELHWKVRGERHEFGMLGQCLSELEVHKKGRGRSGLCETRHFLVVDCPGCSVVRTRLKYELPKFERKDHDEEGWSLLIRGIAYMFDNERRRELAMRTQARGIWDAFEGMNVTDVSEMVGDAECENENCFHVHRYREAMSWVEESGIEREMGELVKDDKYAAFVSHAGPDKDWAVWLGRKLENRGMRTFVDRTKLVGSHCSSHRLMEDAMDEAQVGVFILSPEFFCRKWTMRELGKFLERQKTTKVVIYPLFWKLRWEEAKNPVLYDDERYRGLFHESGFFSPERQEECTTAKAMTMMMELCRFGGLEKDLEELHESSRRKNEFMFWWMSMYRNAVGMICDIFGKFYVERELRGVCVEEYFGYAVDRIARAYKKMKAEEGRFQGGNCDHINSVSGDSGRDRESN